MNIDMQVDEGNKWTKKLIRYLKKHFVSVPKHTYKYILENREFILKEKSINVQDLFKTDKELKQFITYNNKRLDDSSTKIDIIHYNNIKDILTNYIYSKQIKVEINNSFDKHYSKVLNNSSVDNIDIEEDNIDIFDNENFIIPSPETDYQSVLQNLFYNNDVIFGYNRDIERLDTIESAEDIKTATFRIMSKAEDIFLPTKYEWICRANTNGVECGNKFEFSQTHLHNNIKCTLTNGGSDGHTIKNIKDIIPSKVRKLFAYRVRTISQNNQNNIDDESNNEYTVFSFKEITKELVDANYIYVSDKQPFILILGYKYIDSEIENITFKSIDDSKLFFISDMYDTIRDYYKEVHNFKLTNQNKIIAWFIIIQSICKIVLNNRYHGCYFGSSGSGKSIFSKLLIPLFTFNYKVASGSMIKRTKFLGGRSNVTTKFSQSLFEPGFVHQKDILILEECTEKLDALNNPKLPTDDNVFTWIKLADQEIDIGIQGSYSVKPNATLILLGNLEQLVTLRHNYILLLRKKYRNLSSKTLSNKYPLYKSPEYYVSKDENVAKTHSIIRDEYYQHKHYITGLAEAEMSRYTFFVTLEDINEGYKAKEFTGDTNTKFNIHRNEFLTEMFKRFEGATKTPTELKKQVWNWLNDYLGKHRNNIRYNTSHDVNSHVFNHLGDMLSDVLYLNKIYYKQNTETMTKADKKLCTYLLLYNYNVLSKNEANLKNKPKINDHFFDMNELQEYNEQKKEDYRVKLLAKAQKENEETKEDGAIEVDEEGKQSTPEQIDNDIFGRISNNEDF